MNKRFFIPILLFLLLFFLFVHFSSFFKILDLKSLDAFRSTHAPHPDIVILAIDNKSLKQVGRWPWKRSQHAELINILTTYEPELIAYDVTFSEATVEEEDAALAESLNAAPYPVILTSQALYRKGDLKPFSMLLPIPELTRSSQIETGIANIFLNEDGLARIFPEPIDYQNKLYQPFSFTIANILNARIPQDKVFINFAGPSGTFQTISIADVLNGNVEKEILQGKIILVGATASDLRDVLLVPGNRQILPGIEYHANILDNILLNRYIQIVPQIIPISIGIFIFGIFLLASTKISGRLMLSFLLMVIVLLPIISFIAWQKKYALSFSGNTLFVALLLTGNGLYRWYINAKEKRQIKTAFQNYFSPQVMHHILANPELLTLSGRKADLTIFFSDIRSFTTISEKLPPEQLTKLLNEYFNEMTEEIFATDGVVDKFIGDAIMAFWGAPVSQKDSANRAVKTALGMVKRLKRLQKNWADEGLPTVNIGIGINTGSAIVGNMGSSKRFDYSIIGDDVNLASRLEGLNKEYNTSIIISESTKNQLTIKCKTKYLDKVKVKGKTKPVTIYSVSEK